MQKQGIHVEKIQLQEEEEEEEAEEDWHDGDAEPWMCVGFCLLHRKTSSPNSFQTQTRLSKPQIPSLEAVKT